VIGPKHEQRRPHSYERGDGERDSKWPAWHVGSHARRECGDLTPQLTCGRHASGKI